MRRRELVPALAFTQTSSPPGGVPGRHKIDDTQEIDYGFVAKTIAETGFTGSIAHEYRPTPGRDPIQSLTQAPGIMDV